MRRFTALVSAALAGLILAAAWAWAAPTPEQRAEIAALRTQLTKAGNLYTEKKFEEAADIVKDVQQRLEKLAEGADPQTLGQLKESHSRLVRAHALLELEGIALPELKPLEINPPPAKAKAAAKGPATVSFVRDVVPILNNNCGNCHVRNARGMFSMSSYESLMRGPPAGKVVFPGNVPGSDLIVKVQDKEMPPSGRGIPDRDLAVLVKWVEEGARFDGRDPAATLVSLLPAGAQNARQPMPTVRQATGSETVSFAKDVAPVLVQNCVRCHANQNPPGGLTLLTISALFRGGDNGEPVLPGNPASSLLIRKLKGTAGGMRMPARSPPLDDAIVAKIEKWIAEGARFDAPDPNQPIAEVAALAKAASQTHEQLSADREKLAEENWRLGMPNTVPNRASSTNYFVLGSVGENTLADIASRAEDLAPRVADVFKAPRDEPLIKGRLTLFVFGERYDYGEFGKMVEKRDVPPAWRGHFRYSIVDAYGAVLVPKGSEYSLDALIGQQLAAVYMAAQGKGVPRWLAEGCGRVVATRLAPAGDARIAAWDNELSGAIGSMAAPDDFLTGKLPPEQADICCCSFAKFLMNDSKRFGALLDGLRKGGDFARVFASAYGAAPDRVAAVWVRNPPKIGTGRRGNK